MRPDEFLEVAEALRTINRPAALRTAVSRAYCAVFHGAAEAHLRLGARRTRSHDVLGSRLQASPDAAVRLLGDRFLSLEARRIESDYRLGSRAEVEYPATVGAVADAAACFEAGAGVSQDVSVGAQLAPDSGQRVRFSGRVERLIDHADPRERSALVRSGGVSVVLGRQRLEGSWNLSEAVSRFRPEEALLALEVCTRTDGA